ncbi:MAG: GFA family protein [Gammaproteobacteria bacterium]|nr:MAG: GFA family protein [Gammaproteobacteria bacterium]
MLEGGCLCGAVRYAAAAAPRHECFCHCESCRRASGAPFVAWFCVPRAALRFVRGAPARFRSSERAERGFCAACGTTLTFEEDGSQWIDLTAASLDQPALAPPRAHLFVRSRLPWVVPGDGLPEFATWPPRQERIRKARGTLQWAGDLESMRRDR